jgi:(E)-4-hydroxy-3-methylbut-2-enyl-diphosphate synthase
MNIQRNPTRSVKIGTISIGAGHPIAVQSMTATHTTDIPATVALVNDLHRAGADVVRIAVDSDKDAAALAEIRAQTQANLSVDLQENYRLVVQVAPHVNKVRYNPGHLYHHEKSKPWQDKVKFIVEAATANDCAIRVGVNCGSVDPAIKEKFDPHDSIGPMLASATEHCELLDAIGFTRYVVSLKDSDPSKVVEVNRRFAEMRPDVPLHLGVTEAGLPPDGIIKTRIAFEQLIGRGIGDTIRVSLTVPNSKKSMEIETGRQIIDDIYSGRLRGRPGSIEAQHHFLPELFPRGERSVCRVGPAGQGDDAIREGLCHHDCRHGMPREWSGGNRRCRPRPLVRSCQSESEARQRIARRLCLR